MCQDCTHFDYHIMCCNYQQKYENISIGTRSRCNFSKNDEEKDCILIHIGSQKRYWLFQEEDFYYLLFKDQDDLVFVLEDVFEMNNLVGFRAYRQQGNLMQDLHSAVYSIS